MTVTELYARLCSDQIVLERAVLAIDARQTSDELAARDTKYRNGRGWNSADAPYMSKWADRIRRDRNPEGRRVWSSYAVRDLQTRMEKYCGQLLGIPMHEWNAAVNMEADPCTTYCVTFWMGFNDGSPRQKGFDVVRAKDLADARRQFAVRCQTPVSDFGCDVVTHARFWIEAI